MGTGPNSLYKVKTTNWKVSLTVELGLTIPIVPKNERILWIARTTVAGGTMTLAQQWLLYVAGQIYKRLVAPGKGDTDKLGL